MPLPLRRKCFDIGGYDNADNHVLSKGDYSEHMVVLADLNSTVTFKKSVHIDRLKLAYIRQPVPLNYFKATTKVPEAIFRTSATQTVVEKSEQMEVPKVDNDGGYTRPKRLDKVKCILAPRDGPDGLAYLIHFVGEPAHISIW
ncbi:hypothetical protein MAR_004042, partial [Mya arenaria]